VEQFAPHPVSAPAFGTPAGRRSERFPKARRAFYLWLSIELAAGIVALSEITFALPSVILLELGRATVERVLPVLAVSGSLAIYLGRCALPLVAEVALLGQTAA
jgi:hypothetical protein